jgi:outer membrane immunogenic protein
MEMVMKKIILGVAILAFGSSAVMAADMAVKARPMVAPEPVYIWTGGYIGVNVGYAWDNENARETTISGPAFPGLATGTLLYNSPNTFRLHPEGVLGGGQIGYNWQVSPVGVLGVEADIQGAGIKDKVNCVVACGVPQVTVPNNILLNFFPVVFSNDSFQHKIDWFGTVRARAGYAAGPFLLYVTGGLAYGEVSRSGNVVGQTNFLLTGTPVNAFSGGYSTDKTKVGWTAGVGAEGKLSWNPAWSVKGEFLYIDLGSNNDVFNTNFTGGFPPSGIAATRTDHSVNREGLFRLGLNYSFYSPAVVAKY